MKNWQKGLVAGALATAIIAAGATTASAAPVSGGSTGTGVGFTGHVDPDPGNSGDLKLIWAPSAFKFGQEHDVPSAVATFPAINGTTKYVVVDDQRAAAAANAWELTAQASPITSGTKTLASASYQFTGNALKSYTPATNTVAPETAGAISTTLPTGHTASVTSNVTLSAGGASVKIMESTAGAVAGKYAAELNGISLQVPVNAAEEGVQYTGSVNWSLDDTL